MLQFYPETFPIQNYIVSENEDAQSRPLEENQAGPYTGHTQRCLTDVCQVRDEEYCATQVQPQVKRSITNSYRYSYKNKSNSDKISLWNKFPTTKK